MSRYGSRTGLGARQPSETVRRLALVAIGSAAMTVFLGTSGLADSMADDKTTQEATSGASGASPPRSVSVDLTKAYATETFRPDVTPEQRIHVHLDLGRVFETRGNHEAALAEYQQALADCDHKGVGRNRSTEAALANRRIGNALDRLGRFAQAEVHYKKALKLSPRDPKIWNDSGYSYYLQGRFADAERTFRTGADLAPDDLRIATNLGLTLAASGRIDEALPFLSRYSGNAIGHANLGYLLAATGQTELARQQYQKALAIRPNLEVAQRAIHQLDRMEPMLPPEIASGSTGDRPSMEMSPSPRSALPKPVPPVADADDERAAEPEPRPRVSLFRKFTSPSARLTNSSKTPNPGTATPSSRADRSANDPSVTRTSGAAGKIPLPRLFRPNSNSEAETESSP